LWKQKLEPALPSRAFSDLKPYHVHALSQLLVDCQVYELETNKVPANVQAHLQKMAAQSQKDISKYEGVKAVLLSLSVLCIIPKKECVQIALTAIESKDWATFER
jgi:hypothetical protein